MDFPASWIPKGFQYFATVPSGTQLTVPPGANMAIINSATSIVYWRDDGFVPTGATDGQIIRIADPPFYYMGNLAAMRFISSGGTMSVSYYRTNVSL